MKQKRERERAGKKLRRIHFLGDFDMSTNGSYTKHTYDICTDEAINRFGKKGMNLTGWIPTSKTKQTPTRHNNNKKPNKILFWLAYYCVDANMQICKCDINYLSVIYLFLLLLRFFVCVCFVWCVFAWVRVFLPFTLVVGLIAMMPIYCLFGGLCEKFSGLPK